MKFSIEIMLRTIFILLLTGTTVRCWREFSTFKSKVRIFDRDTQESVLISEYYDIDDSRSTQYWAEPMGAMVIRTDRSQQHYVYRPHGNLYTLVDLKTKTGCKSGSLTNPSEIKGISPKIMWNWKHDMINSQMVIGPSGLAMKMYSDFNNKASSRWTLINSSEYIRGMNTKHFRNTLDKVVVDLYLMDSTWSYPELNTYVGQDFIVRITVKGHAVQSKDNWMKNKEADLNLEYDFYFKINELTNSDRELLVIPEFRGCPGTNFTRLYNEHSFTTDGELFIMKTPFDIDFHESDQIDGADIVSTINLQRSITNENLVIEQDKFKKVKGQMMISRIFTMLMTDYKYKYELDDNNTDEFCKVTKSADLGLDINLPDSTVLHFKSASAMFGLTDFRYHGVRMSRGMHVLVFEKTVEKFDGFISLSSGLVTTPVKVIMTLHLSSKSDRIMNKKKNYYYGVPVSQMFTVLDSKNKIQKFVRINFNEFDPNPDGNDMELRFPIELCAKRTSEVKWFRIKYKGNGVHKLYHEYAFLDQQIKVKFENALTTYVKKIRILNTIVTIQNNGFTVTSSLIERPSAIVDFDLYGKNITYVNAVKLPKYYLVLSEDECAKKCLNSLNRVVCRSYVWCDFTCYLWQSVHTPETKSVTTNNTCVMRKLSKSMLDKGYVKMKFNSEIRKLVGDNCGVDEDNVHFNSLALNLRDLSHPYRSNIFYPTKLTVDPFNEETVGRDTYNQSFALSYFGKKLNAESTKFEMDHQTYSSCERACKNEPGFFCETFSYCAISGNCALTDRRILSTDAKPGVTTDRSCAVFIRDFMEDYKHYHGIVLKGKGEKHTVKNNQECAALCTKKHGKKQCESFDYCGQSKSANCILHQQHFLSVQTSGEIDASTRCDHYSRIYSKDFRLIGMYGMTKNQINSIYRNITMPQCARLCAVDDRCRSFDYCGVRIVSTATCSLSRTSFKKGELSASPTCKHYDRIIAIDGTYLGPKGTPKKSAQTKKYSKGTAGALGAVMIVIGLLVGAGAVFGFLYFRSRRT